MKLAILLVVWVALLLQPMCRVRAATDPAGTPVRVGVTRAFTNSPPPALRRSSRPNDPDQAQDPALEPTAGWGEDDDNFDDFGLDQRLPIPSLPSLAGRVFDLRPPLDASRPSPRSPLLRC